MKHVPEVGAARENEAVEVVGGAHGVDHHVGEGAGIESLHLDVVAERGEVAIQRAQLAAAPVVVGVLRGLNRHFHLGSEGGPRGIVIGVLSFHVQCQLEFFSLSLCLSKSCSLFSGFDYEDS